MERFGIVFCIRVFAFLTMLAFVWVHMGGGDVSRSSLGPQTGPARLMPHAWFPECEPPGAPSVYALLPVPCCPSHCRMSAVGLMVEAGLPYTRNYEGGVRILQERCGLHFCFLKKLSGARKLATFYLAKNDHRWVTSIPLKILSNFKNFSLRIW